jgi:DNA-binding MarR family transcriptional regulator
MPESAARLLREVARLHVRAQRDAVARHGASVTQCTILTEVGRAQPMTLATLARRLCLDKGWTSRAIDQLVAEGLVKKAPHEGDGRTFLLSVTRAGATRHGRIDDVLDAQVERVIARVPRAERTNVRKALELLHEAYVAELGPTTNESESLEDATWAARR